MTARLRLALAAVAMSSVAAGAWYWRASAPIADAARAIGVQPENTTPDVASPFMGAGVHKCVGVHGTSYTDGPCPAGTREVAASGGTVTVTSFPKPAQAPASTLPGAPIVRPMDRDERDRLRDKAIEDAANRR